MDTAKLIQFGIWDCGYGISFYSCQFVVPPLFAGKKKPRINTNRVFSAFRGPLRLAVYKFNYIFHQEVRLERLGPVSLKTRLKGFLAAFVGSEGT